MEKSGGSDALFGPRPNTAARTHQRFGGQNAGTWLQLALHHWLVTRREIEMQFGISTSRAEAESKTAAKLVTRMIPGTELASLEARTWPR